jgi:O-antigen ligase
MIDVFAIPSGQRTRLLEGFFILAAAVAVAGFVLKPQFALFAFILCAGVWFLGLVGDALSGRCEGIILLWMAIFPLGYYFLSFPREASVFTLDRMAVLIAFTGLFLKFRTLFTIPRALCWVGGAWLTFAAIAAITLGKSANAVYAARYLIDAFLLPLILAFCVVAGFEVRHRLSAIHTAFCVSSTICAAVGGAEIFTGQDLLPVQNSAMFYAGGIPRPNGPFAAMDQFALVGALSFFFLLFLRAALGAELTTGRRILHMIGRTAALGTALMPMFRSVAITLLLTLVIDTFWEQKIKGRAWRIMLIASSVVLILIAPLFLPNMLIEDRGASDNFYGRVAQLKQSFRVFTDHPALGVGFLNFQNSVEGEPSYVESYEGVSSLDSPHNNLTQVLAETGLLGFIAYVLSQVFIFRAMWQLRRFSGSGRLASKFFLYLFLSYWITGLTESSGYSPLNLVYLFMIAVLYKYAMTSPRPAERVEEAVFPAEAFSVPSRVV